MYIIIQFLLFCFATGIIVSSSIIFLLTCYFIDIVKEQCLLKHSLPFFRKKWHACRMFHVTVVAEIERSQIKAMQYLQKISNWSTFRE